MADDGERKQRRWEVHQSEGGVKDEEDRPYNNEGESTCGPQMKSLLHKEKSAFEKTPDRQFTRRAQLLSKSAFYSPDDRVGLCKSQSLRDLARINLGPCESRVNCKCLTSILLDFRAPHLCTVTSDIAITSLEHSSHQSKSARTECG